MARKVKDYAPLERKRRKRPGRHSKTPNKSFKLQHKKYNKQGRV